MLTYQEALHIAATFDADCAAAFPQKITAVFVTGSLAGSYYRPGQSDIDTLLITDFSRTELPTVKKAVRQIADRYQQQYSVPKGFGAIVFAMEQLYPPYRKEEELIQEILRLKVQSRPVYGCFDTDVIPMPDQTAIKNDFLAFQEWCDAQPPFEHTVLSFVNSTLIALKRYLLLKHHIIEFNKFNVIDTYLQNSPPLTNEEVFRFITAQLHDRGTDWTEEQKRRWLNWHDELHNTINRLVLYNE